MEQRKINLFKRWTLLRYHSIQHILLNLELYFELNDIPRFWVIPSGRRSGKTEVAKRHVVDEAVGTKTEWDINYYFCAAPTRPQAKDIYWNDIKALSRPWWRKKPSETELRVYLKCGDILSDIKVFGMDSPERIEGTPWNGGILDEYGNQKESSFDEHVFPALADRHGWCWLIGVPEGGNHYFRKALKATDNKIPQSHHLKGSIVRSKDDDEWAYAHWFSSDILPAREIRTAKNTLDERTYAQEFEGAFNTDAGSLYYAFNRTLVNNDVAAIDPDEMIYLSCDFNKSPMAWVVGQTDTYRRRTRLKIVDHVTVSHDAKTQRTALDFVKKFATHQNKYVVVTGDASNDVEGHRDFTTDYIIIRETLVKYGWRVVTKVRASNPNVNNRVNIANSVFEHRRCYINGECALLILDLERNESDNHGAKDKTDKGQTHASDAFDYLIWLVFAKEFKELGVAQ